ncbi:MAG: M4 family metallopeptidase, partial [Bacteroidota bacterium]
RFLRSIQLHCTTLDRVIYENEIDPENVIWTEGDAYPGMLSNDQQTLLKGTEQTYNLLFRTFGRDSYDDAGATMNCVENANNLNCPNASAGTTGIFFCPGTITDDIVAHEWSHVYTSATSALIYSWESGAINEGFADMLGEIIDILNTDGNDTNDQTPRTVCDELTNERWKIGEDATALGGHIRDMYIPECKGDPSSKIAAEYICTGIETDNGGVHINSGVFNRSFSLLVDGDTLNTITVNAIGLTKAAHIYHRAWMHYMTRTTDYFALGDALEMAAFDLVGQPLLELTLEDVAPNISGEVIDFLDVIAVQNAVSATFMRTLSNCPFTPALAPDEPDLCDATTEVFTELFSENWANGLANWTVMEVPGDTNTWDTKQWAIETNLPDGRLGQGVFIPNSFVGDCLT